MPTPCCLHLACRFGAGWQARVSIFCFLRALRAGDVVAAGGVTGLCILPMVAYHALPFLPPLLACFANLLLTTAELSATTVTMLFG